jgi:hypothetical protein
MVSLFHNAYKFVIIRSFLLQRIIDLLLPWEFCRDIWGFGVARRMGLWREPGRETRSTSFTISHGILQHIIEFPCHASRASWAYYIKTLSVNSSWSFTFGFTRQVFKSSSSRVGSSEVVVVRYCSELQFSSSQ